MPWSQKCQKELALHLIVLDFFLIALGSTGVGVGSSAFQTFVFTLQTQELVLHALDVLVAYFKQRRYPLCC